MAIFAAVGLLALVFGALFIFAPGLLKRLNEMSMSYAVNFDAKAFDYRMGLGITLIVASLLFFFVAYYMGVRG